MRFPARCRLNGTAAILLSMVVILTTGGCEQTGATAQSALETGATDAPRTVLTPGPAPVAQAPLLLLDGEENEAESPAVADNSRCFVCHINYVAEAIAANHARQNIGCIHCHGGSDAHIADESWGSGGNGTAPDVMYAKDKINPACMACHPKEKIDSPQHEMVFAESDAKVCTDCHGDHRLSQRRCRWR
ncbi:MAG: multiheme c-type cytochrome [Phycisphaerales bacterium]